MLVTARLVHHQREGGGLLGWDLQLENLLIVLMIELEQDKTMNGF